MIYKAPCVIYAGISIRVLGHVGGGWALEIQNFLGPVKWHRAVRRVPFGPQMPASKALRTGPCVNQKSIGGFMYMKAHRAIPGPIAQLWGREDYQVTTVVETWLFQFYIEIKELTPATNFIKTEGSPIP
jgi:hypothetical protein